MMTLMIFAFFTFLTVTLAIQGVLRIVFRRSMIVEERIGHFIGELSADKKTEIPSSKHDKKSSHSRVKQLKQQVYDRMSKESKSEVQKKLEAAGLNQKWSPADYRLIQLLAGALLGSLGVFLGLQGKAHMIVIVMFAATLFSLGFYYPNFYLSLRTRKREEEIEKSLADFFDMVNLSIEAGLGLDAAFMKACSQVKGPLSDEFNIALEEMRLGKSRREAFVNLRSRVAVDEFRSVLTSIIQADQLGIGMAKAIRSLTRQIREHQRQRAREKGMKAPVKMLFPMVFFIFPSIFIVLLGPLMIYLVQYGLK